jgi:hypothetical protein
MGSMATYPGCRVSLGLPPPLSFGYVRSLTDHRVTEKRPPTI